MGKTCNVTHGLSRPGISSHPLYSVWASMKSRCNPKNKNSYQKENYADRGIRVCDEWKEFMPFYNWAIENGWEKGLTIDRIDNDGNYSLENCRIATYSMQNSNKRKSRSMPRNN